VSCGDLWHPADHGRVDLQHGRSGGPRRPCRSDCSAIAGAACGRGLARAGVRHAGHLAARELATFYTVAAIFGFIGAGVMPLYSVIARENFPLRMMGTVIGGMVTAGGLGMATARDRGLIYDLSAATGLSSCRSVSGSARS
jgi:MFS family permease